MPDVQGAASIFFAPPVIGPVTFRSPGPAGVVLTFTTDVVAQCTVQYGPTEAFGSTAADRVAGTNHAIPLLGVVPGATTYYHIDAVVGDPVRVITNSGGDRVRTRDGRRVIRG